jgi:hypothetical protein
VITWEPTLYKPLPDGWTLGLADIVGSTGVIAAGGYKSVNLAGASVITAVANAVGTPEFPFVFGGDGACFAVPPDWAARAREALAATIVYVHDELALSLRAAMVPVSTVRAQGLDVRIARFAPSPNVTYAMFSGGGLAWAEKEMKRGAFAVESAPAGARPDLSNLSCGFEKMPPVNGGVKLGHWGGAKAGQFGYGSSRCGASGPAEMARVSQPGRTRHSGSADGFAGFGIGRSDFAPAARH